MKLLSDACEYGLRAVTWLALRPPQPHTVRDIAAGIHVSPGYLLKVMQELARSEILVAQRGSRGGFMMRSDPAHLTVLDVINAIEPSDHRSRTSALSDETGASATTAVQRCVDEAMALTENKLATMTIRDVVDDEYARLVAADPDHRDESTNAWRRAADGQRS
jgi:Rrf2 family protein